MATINQLVYRMAFKMQENTYSLFRTTDDYTSFDKAALCEKMNDTAMQFIDFQTAHPRLNMSLTPFIAKKAGLEIKGLKLDNLENILALNLAARKIFLSVIPQIIELILKNIDDAGKGLHYFFNPLKDIEKLTFK